MKQDLSLEVSEWWWPMFCEVWYNVLWNKTCYSLLFLHLRTWFFLNFWLFFLTSFEIQMPTLCKLKTKIAIYIICNWWPLLQILYLAIHVLTSCLNLNFDLCLAFDLGDLLEMDLLHNFYVTSFKPRHLKVKYHRTLFTWLNKQQGTTYKS